MFGTKVLIFSTATILKPPKARHFALRNLHYLQLYWISPSGQIYVCKIGQSIKIIYTVTTFISWRGILLCVISYSKISKHKKIRKTNFCCWWKQSLQKRLIETKPNKTSQEQDNNTTLPWFTVSQHIPG